MSTIFDRIEPLPQAGTALRAGDQGPAGLKGHHIRQVALLVSVTAWAAIIYAVA